MFENSRIYLFIYKNINDAFPQILGTLTSEGSDTGKITIDGRLRLDKSASGSKHGPSFLATAERLQQGYRNTTSLPPGAAAPVPMGIGMGSIVEGGAQSMFFEPSVAVSGMSGDSVVSNQDNGEATMSMVKAPGGSSSSSISLGGMAMTAALPSTLKFSPGFDLDGGSSGVHSTGGGSTANGQRSPLPARVIIHQIDLLELHSLNGVTPNSPMVQLTCGLWTKNTTVRWIGETLR